MTSKSDRDLMQAVNNKDTLALKELYYRYEKKIFNFLLRYTGSRELSQELLQETFTRAWFSAHTFDLVGGNFGGWIYTIALNIARSEMSKKEYTYRFVDPSTNREWLQDAEAPGNDSTTGHLAIDPQVKMEQEEMKEQASRALGQLKPYLREVIIMKHYQHLKFREIATITGLPEGTLKARYQRGVELLKEFLNLTEVHHAE